MKTEYPTKIEALKDANCHIKKTRTMRGLMMKKPAKMANARETTPGKFTAEVLTVLDMLVPEHQTHVAETGWGPEGIKPILMETTTLRTLLISPETREETLQALWGEPRRQAVAGKLPEEVVDIPTISMSTGKNDALRIAKVLTLGSGGELEMSMVFDSPSTGKTWMVSEYNISKHEEAKSRHTPKRKQKVRGRKELICHTARNLPDLETQLDEIPGVAIDRVIDAVWCTRPILNDPEGTPDGTSLCEQLLGTLVASPEEKARKTRALNCAVIPLRTDFPK